MHANRLMPNVYRKKLLAFTINTLRRLSVLIFNSVTGEILYVDLLIK